MTDSEANLTQTQSFLNRPLPSSWVVVLLLYAAIQLTHPYVGIVHDASLYGAQASRANQPEIWDSDLFFRYGSQDKFTVFSKMTGPVIALLGIQTGFALLFAIGHLLFVSGLWAIAQVLFPDRRLAILAAMMMALMNVPFAGFGTFQVVEAYLTPRLFAIPLSLWAIRFGFQSQYFRSGLCLVVAGAFHPLYITGPWLCLMGMWLWPRPRLFVLAFILASLGAALILGVESIGSKVLGTMDDEWRAMIRACTKYNFITEWMIDDFVMILVAVFVHCIAIWLSPRFRLLCISCVITIAIACLGSLLAELLHYKMLFQGQPYRALWLPQLLALPVSVEIVRVSWKSPFVPSVSSLFGFFMVLLGVHMNQAIILSLLGAAVGGYLMRSSQPKKGAIIGFAILFCLVRILDTTKSIAEWLNPQNEYGVYSPALKWTVLWNYLGPVLKIMVGGLLILAQQRFKWFVIFAMLLSLTTMGLASRCDGIHQHRNSMQENTSFVLSHLSAHSDVSKRPQIYWPGHLGGSAMLIWFYAHSECYVNDIQCAGVIFNRGTAMEAKRRWSLVMPLAFGSQQAESPLGADFSIRFHHPNGYNLDPEKRLLPKTTTQDMLRLAAEPDLDWVISDMNFPELSPIGNGSIFMYDMQKLRRERNLPDPSK
ncbi:MAG: hypothetical protein ACRC8S_17705 [Fimbriiglobus sp.]